MDFTFIPFEPWWALTIIFIDLWVIHALFAPTPARLAEGSRSNGR
jgi:hypothetical protein